MRISVISEVLNSLVGHAHLRQLTHPYISMWKNIDNYKGKTSRREYWLAHLVSIGLLIFGYCMNYLINILGFTPIVFSGGEQKSILQIASYSISLVLVISYAFASLSLFVRRMRDLGLSMLFTAFLVILNAIPIIGIFSWIYTIILLCQPSYKKET